MTKNINDISKEEIISWILEHKLLTEDFENHFHTKIKGLTEEEQKELD